MTAAPAGRTRRPAGAAASAALLLLSACTPADTGRASGEVLQQVLESHRATIAGLGAPPPVPAREAATAPRAAPGSVAALLGQTPGSVVSTLGQPTRRRPEGEAEIWLYQGTNCALDVVIYREAAGPRVAWAAARAAGTERRTEAGCLSELASG